MLLLLKGGASMEKEKLLTPTEVAERLQVNLKAVRGWLRIGKLKGAKIGKYWRIPERDLEDFVNTGREKAKKNLIEK
jgi:excisionase family DNA binding protein